MRLMDLSTLAISNAISVSVTDLLDGDLMGLQTSFLCVDYSGFKLLQITNPGGVATTLVGSGTLGTTDGVGTSATLNYPITVTVWRCGIPGYGIVTSDSVCERCPTGKYSSSGEVCLNCPTGKFASTVGSSACTDRGYFQFDTRSGDYQYGPDGTVQYTGTSAMTANLGTVTVSSGSTTVNGQTIPRGMQIWTVGATGWYDIVAGGASGADALKQTGSFYGGRGVAVKSRYYLAAGANVVVAVGMKPTGCSSTALYGAGGGSFVSLYAATGTFATSGQHTLVLAAGGGGSVGNNAGVDATTDTSGAKCRSNPATAVASSGGGGGGGAAAGGAGAIGSSTNGGGNGAGGGGFLADGGDGYYSVANQETKGGKAFLAGCAGGFTIGPRSTTACTVTGISSPGIDDPPGGFGGGGGGWNAGGGGGGYSGGQGCGSADRQGGGGGGSYVWNGAGNAGALYTNWDISVFGTAPTGFSNGYLSSDGKVVISTQTCAAGKYSAPNTVVSGTLAFTTNGIHVSCFLIYAFLDSVQGWCAQTLSVNLYYLVLDAGSVGLIDSVVTQGRSDTDQWVTAYDLSYSVDSTTWVFFGNLVGNTDRNTKVTRALNVVARYLRLTPTAYYNHPSMRAGYSANTNIVCQSCPAGTFSLQNLQATVCTTCPLGTYSNLGATTCTSCEAGKYGSTTGLAGCTLCPAGTFSLSVSQILSSACVACPASSTSNSTRTGCVANAGYYNLDSNLLAYYPFRPENVYTDASYSGYGLTDTNGASYKPQSEFNTGPFAGAGVVYMDNNNVLELSGVSRSFKISLGAGINLGSMFGTDVAPNAGFSVCGWYRAKDGPTAGVVNAVNSYQVLISLLTLPVTSSAEPTMSQISFYRQSLSNDMTLYVRSTTPENNNLRLYGAFTRTWSHFCAAGVGRTVNIFVNCNSSSCQPLVLTLGFNVISQLYPYGYIGEDFDPPWYGWISEVRMYRKALTPAEVFAVRSYAGTTSFSVNGDPALLAYYPFSSSNIYADASGNGYTLTDTNTGGYSPSYAGGTTAPFPGAGAAYFANSGGTSYAGVTVTTATTSPAQSFRISVGTGWSLSAYIGTSASPGPGFSWCYWIRGADGATAGTLNTISYPFAFWLGNQFSRVTNAGFYGFYDGRDNSAAGKGGTNYWNAGGAKGGIGTTGLYTRDWAHACFTWQGTAFKGYVNCGSSTCTPVSTTLGAEAYSGLYTQVLIGQGGYSTAWFGWLSEFRFYKKALTASEVFAIKSFDGTSPTAVNSVNAGLLAYYPFHPNAFLLDASGVTGTLSPTNSPASIAGSLTDLQNVAYFAQASGVAKASATPQYLTIPSITIGSYFSICVWYNPDGASSVGYAMVVLLSSSGTTGATGTGDIQIRRDGGASTNLVIQIANGNTGIAATTYTGLYQYNVWQHVCLTVSGTTGKVYYNGVLQATTVTLSALHATTTFTTSYLGGMNAWSNDLYRGQLDEVRIYGRAITASEVTSIYNFRGDTYTPAIVLPCLAGTYSDSTVTACTACAAGSFSSASGFTACTSCSAGSYVASTGFTACVSCSAGSYATSTGSTVCTSCPANSWSTGGTSRCTANLGYYNLDDSANLKAYYTFNPGALLQDVTGTTGSLTASASSPTSQTSGPFGASSSSAFLTGSASTSPSSNQYFTLPAFQLPDAVSMCSWFWISPSVTRNWNRIWDFGIGAGNSNVLGAIKYNTNDLGFDVYRGGTTIGLRSLTNGAQSTSTWSHVCMTLSGTSQVIWLNGVSTSFTMSNTRDPTVQLTTNYLGRSNWGADLYWYGAIDEFRIYHKALTSAEVAALYAFRGDTYVPLIILACPSPCAAGTYGGCTSSGAQACTSCPAGAYSTGIGMTSSSTCISCGAGTYFASSGGTCASCPAGTYSGTTGASLSSVCVLCAAGTYSSSAGATSVQTCNACSVGQYSTITGAVSSLTCAECPAGTYNSAFGASFCTACAVGKYSDPPGAMDEYTCIPCAEGTYSNVLGASTICPSCSAGTYSGTGASACTFCSNGKYSGFQALTCIPCQAGTYYTGTGAPACTACLAGTYQTGTGFTVCTACQAGTYQTGTGMTLSAACTACQAGTYQTGMGVTTSAGCIGCQTGTYSATTAAPTSGTCLACVGGKYSASTGASLPGTCQTCSNGYFSLASASACSACLAGTYGGGIGVSACPVCGAGQYSSGDGQLACISCLAGTYSAVQGASTATVCQTCQAGTYSAVQGASTATVCQTCGAGKYSSSDGQTNCSACPAGTYSTLQGASMASVCQACAAGSYTGTTGLSVCTACANLGVTCPAGTTFRCSSSQPVGVCCGVNQYFRESQDTACQNCAVGKFTLDGGKTACLACMTTPVSALYANYSKVPMELKPFPLSVEYDIPNYKVIAFDIPGPYSVWLNEQTYADFLLVGGGGAGSLSAKYSGGGGAGSVLFYPNAFLGATEYHSVTVGNGGGFYPGYEMGGYTFINSARTNFGYSPYFAALYGGGAGAWPDNQVTRGGGGGGACDTTNCQSKRAGVVIQSSVDLHAVYPGPTGDSRFVLASAGGFGSLMNSGSEAVNNGLHGGGGGGAGAAGGNEVEWTAACSSSNQAACGRCGYGGDGVAGITIDGVFYNFSTFFGKAYTDRAEDGYIAGGGGGGGYSSYGVIRCKGGRGGGGAGYKSNSLANRGENGRAGTGGGGGGSNDVSGSGGLGGSGMLLMRLTTMCVCDVGSYSGNQGCTACPAGTFSTGTGVIGVAACSSCQAGTYSPGVGITDSNTCQSCQAGTYQTGTGMQTNLACTACTAGYYATGTGFTLASNCLACSAGTYGLTAGLTVCATCAAGTYSVTAGASLASVCTACPAGTYGLTAGASLASVCVQCVAGTYGLTAGVSLASVCTSCLAGTYGLTAGASLASMCVQCVAGTYGLTAGGSLASVCIQCVAGTYGLTAGASLASVCTSCPAGTYGLAAGASLASACTPCAAGTYGLTAGASLANVCVQCVAGTYGLTAGGSLASACTSCSAGTYGLTAGASLASVCIACSAGKYSGISGASLASACLACSAGTYSGASGASSSGTCTPCSAGSYGTGTGLVLVSQCVACSAGTYSGTSGASLASTCLPCMAGTYSGTSGASSSGTCVACIAGYYATGTGFTLISQCVACSMGTYSGTSGASLASACVLCPAGSYNMATGVSACTPCSAGTFSGVIGRIDACNACPAGSYSGTTGASLISVCQACSAGLYSTALGATIASTCQQCSAGTYFTGTSLQTSASCTACSAGSYSTASGASLASICLLCQAGTYQTGAGMQTSLACTSCSIGSYSGAVGAISSATCVACPAGVWSGSSGSSTCSPCSAGTYQTGTGTTAGSTCSLCVYGTYSSALAAQSPSTCSPCGAGTYGVIAGATSSAQACTACGIGSYSLSGASICQPCQPGTASNVAGVSVCPACLAGSFSVSLGSYTCTPCSAGSYSGTAGASLASTCQACIAGSYLTGTGLTASAACTSCTPGTYSTSSGASSSSACQLCQSGTFQTGTGMPASGACTACDTGTYMTQQGGTGCTGCPSNSNTTSTGTSQRGGCTCDPGFVGNLSVLSQNCSTCPANSYCVGPYQTSCPSHTHSPAQSSLPVHCRCDAGYRCSYRRDLGLNIRFNLNLASFTSQSASIRTKLATAADVPVSNVSLVSATTPPPFGFM